MIDLSDLNGSLLSKASKSARLSLNCALGLYLTALLSALLPTPPDHLVSDTYLGLSVVRETERFKLLLIADALMTFSLQIPRISQIDSAVRVVAVAVKAKTRFTLSAAKACLILK